MVAPVSISAGLLTLLACGLVLNPAVRAVIGLAADRLIGSKEFLAYAVPIDMAVATFAFVRTGAAITPTQKQLVATAEIIFAAIPTGLMVGVSPMVPYINGGAPLFFWSPCIGVLAGGLVAMFVQGHRAPSIRDS